MKKILFSVLVVFSAGALASECKTNIEPTTKTEDFINNGDGTVTDLRFGLQWQLCTYGQQYDPAGKTCKGDQKQYKTWSDAILSQDSINGEKPQGFSDWRLPNIKELQSLVERRCSQPAINPDVFKGTANGVYWSNTPDGTVNYELLGRVVNFSNGTEYLADIDTPKFVRHVRVIK